MSTYWHVAHESYRGGAPLVCRDDQAAYGIQTPWKWDHADEGLDGSVVCLFPDTPRGHEEADWLWFDYPSYVLLRIDADESTYAITVTEEGYPAIWGKIGAEAITVIQRGYAEDIIRQAGVDTR